MIEGIRPRDILVAVLELTSAGAEPLWAAMYRTATFEDLARYLGAPIEHIAIKVRGLIAKGCWQTTPSTRESPPTPKCG